MAENPPSGVGDRLARYHRSIDSRLVLGLSDLFGIPFLILIVGGSFGLQSFTQTRYDPLATEFSSPR